MSDPRELRLTGQHDHVVTLADSSGTTYHVASSPDLLLAVAQALPGASTNPQPPAPQRPEAPAPPAANSPTPAPARLPVSALPSPSASRSRSEGATSTPRPSATRQEPVVESTLRPRDIQARVRAGESPEALADASGMPLSRVMIYANPVLAEREHVAQLAQSATVRGANGHGVLSDLVVPHLYANRLGEEDVTWDAWRRPDGKWSLRATVEADTLRVAEFCFDQPGRYVVVENPDAQWLIGQVEPSQGAFEADLRAIGVLRESSHVVLPPPPPADFRPRVVESSKAPAAEADGEVELSDDLPTDLGSTPDAVHDPVGTPELLLPEDVDTAGAPAGSAGTSNDSRSEQAQTRTERGVSQEDTALPLDELPEATGPSQAKRPRGRASVPSWDEIMFGTPEGS